MWLLIKYVQIMRFVFTVTPEINLWLGYHFISKHKYMTLYHPLSYSKT